MKKYLAIAFSYFILSILITWPLATNLSSLVIDRADGVLNTWMFAWNAHFLSSIFDGSVNYYNSNIFYPYINTFAFSDFHLPVGMLLAPLTWIFGEPLLTYNVSIIFGLTLTALSMYILAKKLTGSFKISFVAGILVSFSQIHLGYIAHQQMFQFWPLIFGIYSIIFKKRKILFLMLIICGLQAAQYAFFLSLAVTCWWVVNFSKNKKEIIRSAVPFGLGGLLLTIIMWPFFMVSKTFSYVRPITDVINFSLQAPDLLNVSAFSRLSQYFPQIRPGGTQAWLGVIIFALIIAVVKNIKRLWRESLYSRFFILFGSFSLILTFGPALHIFTNTIHVGPIPAIPLPYLIFYYLIPGFAGIRTPSRWIIPFFIAAVVLISIWLKKQKKLNLILFIVSLLVIIEINFPFKYYSVKNTTQFPPEQKWLAANYKNDPIIQLPIYGWWDKEGLFVETEREYYSTIHWHPMFNGYSGFSPTEWEKRVKLFQDEFPSDNTIKLIKSLNIRLILVPNEWREKMKPFKDVKLVKSFTNTAIYQIQ